MNIQHFDKQFEFLIIIILLSISILMLFIFKLKSYYRTKKIYFEYNENIKILDAIGKFNSYCILNKQKEKIITIPDWKNKKDVNKIYSFLKQNDFLE